MKIEILAIYEQCGCWRNVSYLDIDGAQSSRKGEYVVKSKSTSWNAARWSIGVTDHVTGDDRYDQHAG